jgi:hypothetical protein
MKNRLRSYGAAAVFAFAAAAFPLAGLVSPAVSQAEDDCAADFYLNTATNVCTYCGPGWFWDYPTNQCLLVDPTPYVDPNPVVGPVGPVGVGPNPVVGPVGPVGVGPGPVAGPVGPVGVGGVGPVLGPAGPGGIGRR